MIALDVLAVEGEDAKIVGAGGSCGNVLTELAYFGWESYPVICLGADAEAEIVREDMAKFGVRSDLIESAAEIGTPVVVVRLAAHGNPPKHAFEFTCPACGAKLPRRKTITRKLLERALDAVPAAEVCYLDRATSAAVRMARAYRGTGGLVVFEPCAVTDSREFEALLRLAHILKYSGEQVDLSGRRLRVPLEVKTLGAEGIRLRFRGRTETLPALPADGMVDTTGAGDWLTAGMLDGIGRRGSAALRWLTYEEVMSAVRFGQALATINCNYFGARGLMLVVGAAKAREMAESFLAGKAPGKVLVSEELWPFKFVYRCNACALRGKAE